jgi:hypothetical protein
VRVERLSYLTPKFDFIRVGEIGEFNFVKLETVILGKMNINIQYEVLHSGCFEHTDGLDIWKSHPRFKSGVPYNKTYWYIDNKQKSKLPNDILSLLNKTERSNKLTQILK